MATGTTRGLAAALHGWDDDRLAALLLARPDLARPVPASVETLAARACSPPSVTSLLPDLSIGDLQSAQDALAGHAPSQRLQELALAWDEDGWVLAGALAEQVGRADLGPRRPDAPETPLATVAHESAGHAAAQAISLMDELLWRLQLDPPRVLRTGGLPVAGLRSFARALDVDTATCALALEVAQGARLLGEAGDEDAQWAPSAEYDEWRLLPPADRWAALATTWVDLRAAPHLVGTPTAHGKGTTNALSAEVVWPPMRTLRRHVLDELATLEGAPSLDGLVDRLRWRHPFIRVADHPGVSAAVLREATWLGIVAGGLTAPGRVLLDGPSEQAAAVMAPLLPQPADRVLLGADLTAVVPGLVDGPLADLLRASADIESRGGASVYRFGAASVERALDAGWTASALRTRLEEVAGELPQALGFLLDDAARRHAALAVGGVSSYLRCDEPSTLAELAASPRLGLRLVAPTVAVSALAPTVLVARLRAAGRVPAVEGPDGEVHVIGSAPVRSPVRRRPAGRVPLDAAAAADAVAALRGGPPVSTTDVTEPELVRALLGEAAARGTTVRVDYVGSGGVPVVVDLEPSGVDAGRVRGVVDGVEQLIPLPRISRVRA